MSADGVVPALAAVAARVVADPRQLRLGRLSFASGIASSRATNAPGFGIGVPGRARSKGGMPDRRILRTGFRPMPRSRLIRLLLLPRTKWSRRTLAVVSRKIIPALSTTSSRLTTDVAAHPQGWVDSPRRSPR